MTSTLAFWTAHFCVHTCSLKIYTYLANVLWHATRCKTTNSPVVPFQEKSSFHFVVLWKLLNGMEWLKLLIEVKYIRIILSPNLMDLVVFLYLNGGFDAWPINTEFLGDDRAIFRVGFFCSLAFYCKILNMPWYFDKT